jgi:hypothetical protein
MNDGHRHILDLLLPGRLLLLDLTSTHSLALVVMLACTFKFFAEGNTSIMGESGTIWGHKEQVIKMSFIQGACLAWDIGASGLGYLCGGPTGVPLFKAEQV